MPGGRAGFEVARSSRRSSRVGKKGISPDTVASRRGVSVEGGSVAGVAPWVEAGWWIAPGVAKHVAFREMHVRRDLDQPKRCGGTPTSESLGR